MAWTGANALVTDAGLETWLVFHRGVDLPAFAAYPLVDDEAGRALLIEYYGNYLAIARSAGMGLVLETPTWRANPEWAATLGHDLDDLGRLLDASVQLVREAGAGWSSTEPLVVSGTLGPRGDGYVLGATMDAAAAQQYHSFQIGRLAAAGVDVVTALTIGYVEEAVGIVRSAAAHDVAAVISFTVETDGRLPSGAMLGEAIDAVDHATDGGPLHYMINCAHPTHFDHVLDDGTWRDRIGGIRANASTLSHAELDAMEVLDDGDPDDLAARYVALAERLPAVRVIGGCCGTDERHVAAIAAAWSSRVARERR